MLFDLPDHDTLYRALIERDARYDGHAYVGVTTTGVFCRLTCPARKPLAENCRFYATVGECIDAGFRACKRCHPLAPIAERDPVIARLLAALDEQPQRIWREGHIAAMGLDPSTVRRSFKRHFGMTFLEMARQRRLRDGFATLEGGGKVIDAQVNAGFESASAFSAAFARLLGRSPGKLASDPLLLAQWIPTPLGDMLAVSSQRELHLLEFFDRKALPGELSRLEKSVGGRLGIGPTEPSAQIEAELGNFLPARALNSPRPLPTTARHSPLRSGTPCARYHRGRRAATATSPGASGSPRRPAPWPVPMVLTSWRWWFPATA